MKTIVYSLLSWYKLGKWKHCPLKAHFHVKTYLMDLSKQLVADHSNFAMNSCYFRINNNNKSNGNNKVFKSVMARVLVEAEYLHSIKNLKLR